MSLAQEAKIIFKFLLVKEPSQKFIDRYVAASQVKQISLDADDEKLLVAILKRPWIVGHVDSFFALTKSKSGVRQKVQLANAIAEASPEYAELFLPQEFGFSKLFTIGFTGLRAVLSFVLGFFIVKVYG